MTTGATIQVDVDPLWFIASLRSDQEVCECSQTIYELAVPRFLEFFASRDIKATFFIVGKDMEDERNLSIMRQMINAGHELANHTYMHRTDLRSMSRGDLHNQVTLSEELAYSNLGVKFVGFKSPAYGVTGRILEELCSKGYLYDSSVCPNIAASLVKQFQRFCLGYKDNLAEFGAWYSCLAPLAPYRPDIEEPYSRGSSTLLEVPVSTMPLFRLPFHFSFINFLGFSWWRLGWQIWKLNKPPVLNYAFHAIDFLDTSDVPAGFHWRPGLKLPWLEKKQRAEAILDSIQSEYPIYRTKKLVDNLTHNDGEIEKGLK